MNDIVRGCDALLARCAEIRKSSQWNAVEKLKQDAIDWFRRAGLSREGWWADLQNLQFAVAAESGVNSHMQNLRFAAESGVMPGSLYQERFLQYHMDRALQIERRLEDARQNVRKEENSHRILPELDRAIVAIHQATPTLKQRELCVKVDAAFEKANREVPLPKSWKRRDPTIRSMKDAFDSRRLHNVVKTRISKLRRRRPALSER
jgi:hypothetical protein